MKKIVFTLVMAFMLMPSKMFADHYNYDQLKSFPSFPVKGPVQNLIVFSLDYSTGDLEITPNYDITGLNITITGDGVTYLNTTVSLSAGQSYTDCLDYLPVGTYILTLSTVDGVIDQYEITVEDDE